MDMNVRTHADAVSIRECQSVRMRPGAGRLGTRHTIVDILTSWNKAIKHQLNTNYLGSLVYFN